MFSLFLSSFAQPDECSQKSQRQSQFLSLSLCLPLPCPCLTFLLTVVLLEPMTAACPSGFLLLSFPFWLFRLGSRRRPIRYFFCLCSSTFFLVFAHFVYNFRFLRLCLFFGVIKNLCSITRWSLFVFFLVCLRYPFLSTIGRLAWEPSGFLHISLPLFFLCICFCFPRHGGVPVMPSIIVLPLPHPCSTIPTIPTIPAIKRIGLRPILLSHPSHGRTFFTLRKWYICCIGMHAGRFSFLPEGTLVRWKKFSSPFCFVLFFYILWEWEHKHQGSPFRFVFLADSPYL